MIALLLAVATPALTKLLPTCSDVAASHGICGSDIYKPVWRTFESSNGEVFKVDTHSVEATGQGQGFLTIYMGAPGAPFDEAHLMRVFVTCHGRYALGNDLTDLMDAPPRSSIGQIATAMCPAIAEKERRVRSILPRGQINIYSPKE